MIPAIISGVSNLLSGFMNQGYNERNMELQARYAQNLADYQWRKYQSPKAQVEALQDAGINPGTIFGEKGGSSLPSPSMNMPSSAPVSVPPLFSLSDMSNYIQSVASAKKAGMDTKLAEQEISNKEVERQTKEFEFGLLKEFGKEFKTVELASAYRNLLLASDSHDLNVQQKAINEWKQVSEKAVAQANEHQRDILALRLNNEPIAIRLDNDLKGEKIKTEQATQANHYSQASVNKELRRINKVLADIEEGAKDDKLLSLISEYQAKNLISDADAEAARLKVGRLHDQNVVRGSDDFMRGLDDILEYLKDKVSIFK